MPRLRVDRLESNALTPRKARYNAPMIFSAKKSVSDAAKTEPKPNIESAIRLAIAQVLPSATNRALRVPDCTAVEMLINTLGPGLTVNTKTAATYSNQVERCIVF
jgi:hypothetical protein